MLRRMLLATVLFGLLGCEQEDHLSHVDSGELKLVAMEKISAFVDSSDWKNDLPLYSQGYFAEADPRLDLQAAQELAQAEKKVIMMIVGGDWCSWCHVMTRFFSEKKLVRDLLLSKVVLLKVNMSEDNDNAQFLSNYPKIVGYPHMFMLSASGELLSSVDTAKLENGRSYSEQRFTELLESY